MLQFLLLLYNQRPRPKNPKWLAIKTMTDSFPPIGGNGGKKGKTQLGKHSKTSVEHIAESLLNNYQIPSTEL